MDLFTRGARKAAEFLTAFDREGDKEVRPRKQITLRIAPGAEHSSRGGTGGRVARG
jgi:hypothetical protein